MSDMSGSERKKKSDCFQQLSPEGKLSRLRKQLGIRLTSSHSNKIHHIVTEVSTIEYNTENNRS